MKVQKKDWIGDRLRRRRRVSMLPLLLGAAVMVVSTAGSPTVAQGYAETFCNGVLYQPYGSCIGNYFDWDRVRSRYPGHQAHGVYGCVYQMNLEDRIRGGIYCNPTWSEPTWNPMGHNYGVTSSNYFALNRLEAPHPHTLVGWASNNQTDG